ncbi:MAG: hypothetical protein ACRCU6_00290 [Fusobacteriaceae bacterium]
MHFNFVEANRKHRVAQIESELYYKIFIAGLFRETVKYKECESKVFPIPYRAEENHGYIEPKFKSFSTILLKEITLLKDFDKIPIPELLLRKIDLEFLLVSKDTFKVDDGTDTNFSREYQKEKLGEFGAQMLQHYFYMKTWLELAKRKKYIPKDKVKNFDKFFRNFYKIQEFWEKSVLI